MKKLYKFLTYTTAIMVVLLIFQFGATVDGDAINKWVSLESLQVLGGFVFLMSIVLLPHLIKSKVRKMSQRYYSARSVLLSNEKGLYVQVLD